MMEDFDMSLLNRRNFLLMLSPAASDPVTERGNFAAPSPDVQDQEITDVITSWLRFAAIGTLRHVDNCTRWLADFLVDIEEDDDMEEVEHLTEMVRAGYYSFAVAMLNHLLEEGAIELVQMGEMDDNIMHFVNNRPMSFALDVQAFTFDFNEDKDE